MSSNVSWCNNQISQNQNNSGKGRRSRLQYCNETDNNNKSRSKIWFSKWQVGISLRSCWVWLTAKNCIARSAEKGVRAAIATATSMSNTNQTFATVKLASFKKSSSSSSSWSCLGGMMWWDIIYYNYKVYRATTTKASHPRIIKIKTKNLPNNTNNNKMNNHQGCNCNVTMLFALVVIIIVVVVLMMMVC